ncbi:hypothetical protein DFP73DRAFT_534528, partial [Morchella snyderi]
MVTFLAGTSSQGKGLLLTSIGLVGIEPGSSLTVGTCGDLAPLAFYGFPGTRAGGYHSFAQNPFGLSFLLFLFPEDCNKRRILRLPLAISDPGVLKCSKRTVA